MDRMGPKLDIMRIMSVHSLRNCSNELPFYRVLLLGFFCVPQTMGDGIFNVPGHQTTLQRYLVTKVIDYRTLVASPLISLVEVLPDRVASLALATDFASIRSGEAASTITVLEGILLMSFRSLRGTSTAVCSVFGPVLLSITHLSNIATQALPPPQRDQC